MCDTFSLSHEQEQIIFGGLFGDCYFSNKKNIIRFNHSEKQLQYFLWKMNHFDSIDLHKISERIYPDGKYIGYTFDFVNKKNKYINLFNFINKYFYKNGHRKISLKGLNKLDSLGLAIWWMDDGCLSVCKGNRYGKLCTHAYNYEENILIQKYFHDRWGIDTDIKCEKGKYYFQRFNVKALKILISIIYKHVCEIPDMIYKIDMNYKNEKSIGTFKEIYDYIKKHNLSMEL